MSFVTPSERLGASLKRFFLLRPLDGPRLLRATWILALIFYGLQTLAWALSILSYSMTVQQIPDFWMWWQFAGRSIFAMFGPLLWLIIIRLVLEACARVFANFPR